MLPHPALIATVAASFGIAFLFGLAAARVKLPPIVGYLLAGMAVGTIAPPDLIDGSMVAQAAELGVILLMFGVGLHFSFRDLAAVRRVAVPGALLQILITGSVGAAIGRSWGLGWGGAAVLGISLAVASTVVLLKGLEAQDRLDSPDGRLAVGWLVVEDLAMVLVLVLLPALATMIPGSGAGDAAQVFTTLAIALIKVAIFTALMVVVGRRAVPWLLEHVARVGSRELFTLAVLATALGIATLAAEVFGVSFALGAFFAGAVVSESELSHRAATDALPLQDAFAVLFFVSVGLLFDPAVLTQSPGAVLALVTVIVLGKFVVSAVLMRLLRQPLRSSLIIGGSLAQIGEFSFIVAGMGVTLHLITGDVQAKIVAAALISIAINAPMQAGILALLRRAEERRLRLASVIAGGAWGAVERDEGVPSTARASRAPMNTMEDPFDFSRFHGHVVVVGHGRVGTTITDALQRETARYVIIDEQEQLIAGLRAGGARAVYGDATRRGVLQRAGVANARLIIVTAPEPIRARRIVAVAREMNPAIAIGVRTHSAVEQAFFEEFVNSPNATGKAVYAEREAALSLAHFTLQTLGRSGDEADVVIDTMRQMKIAPTETFAALHTREFRAMMAPDPNHPTEL